MKRTAFDLEPSCIQKLNINGFRGQAKLQKDICIKIKKLNTAVSIFFLLIPQNYRRNRGYFSKNDYFFFNENGNRRNVFVMKKII